MHCEDRNRRNRSKTMFVFKIYFYWFDDISITLYDRAAGFQCWRKSFDFFIVLTRLSGNPSNFSSESLRDIQLSLSFTDARIFIEFLLITWLFLGKEVKKTNIYLVELYKSVWKLETSWKWSDTFSDCLLTPRFEASKKRRFQTL